MKKRIDKKMVLGLCVVVILFIIGKAERRKSLLKTDFSGSFHVKKAKYIEHPSNIRKNPFKVLKSTGQVVIIDIKVGNCGGKWRCSWDLMIIPSIQKGE